MDSQPVRRVWPVTRLLLGLLLCSVILGAALYQVKWANEAQGADASQEKGGSGLFPFRFTVSPTQQSNGNNCIGTITLPFPAPFPDGFIVKMKASSEKLVNIPIEETVLPGEMSTTFTINTEAVKTNQQVKITAEGPLARVPLPTRTHTANLTLLALPPDEPENVEIQDTPTGLILSWNQPDCPLNYEISRSENENGPYKLIVDNLQGFAFEDGTVKPGHSYYYRVRAVNLAGMKSR